MQNRRPRPLKEGPRAPQYDGRYKSELNPLRRAIGKKRFTFSNPRWPPISKTKTGAASTRTNHKAPGHVLEFRIRAFGLRMPAGSSAIPRSDSCPGPLLLICGCIGQVKIVSAVGEAVGVHRGRGT